MLCETTLKVGDSVTLIKPTNQSFSDGRIMKINPCNDECYVQYAGQDFGTFTHLSNLKPYVRKVTPDHLKSEFQKEVYRQITKAIRKIRRKGTVGMSIANLCQITETPSEDLEGAPAGPEGYREIFREEALKVAQTINKNCFRLYE